MPKRYTFEEFLKVATVGMRVRVYHPRVLSGDIEGTLSKVRMIEENKIYCNNMSVDSSSSSNTTFEILQNYPWEKLKVGDKVMLDDSGLYRVLEVTDHLFAVTNGMDGIAWFERENRGNYWAIVSSEVE